jgi:hypothetical protein
VDIVTAKLEKDHRKLSEIIQLYEAGDRSGGPSDPDYSFFLSCHRTRLLELESELSARDILVA